jgi:predicted enzyme related to lactoylglutathione lyase
MRGTMRGVALFLAGIIVGAGLMTSLAAQGTLNTGLRLNHVGISVPNFQEAVNFYEKVMGFRVSHRFAPNPDGRPGTAFVQISRDTFIEIAPAMPDAKPTITHIGIGADDIKATVGRLAQNGGKATEPNRSANSGSILANITDPAGIRTELNEQPSGSMMRQAIDSWK